MSDKQDEIEQRLDFVRKCLARELRDYETVAACQDDQLFWVDRKRGRKTTTRPMTAAAIKKQYIYKVRKYLRDEIFDGQDEVIRARERILHLYREAIEAGDRHNALSACKEYHYLMGLGRSNMAFAADIPEDIVDDLMRTILPSGRNQEKRRATTKTKRPKKT